MADVTIHPKALSNSLSAADLHLRSDAQGRLGVEPARAGWRYLSFRAQPLAGGAAEPLDNRLEHVVVVIHGANVRVVPAAGEPVVARGRSSPFMSLPGAVYVPAGSGAQVLVEDDPPAAQSLVAIASAPPSGRAGVAQGPVAIEPRDVRVEIRGAGNATRQINHIVAPEFPADRLEVVEVLTPSGNWSSWPPHKHDVDDPPREAVLEEIYYYRFNRPAAWGMQRLYRAGRRRDCLWEVRSGDVVLVTDGYHPFAAVPGDDAYYLNALAGDRRTMACSFDPDYDWVRDTWTEMAPDPRVPLVR